jgi:hypothetical protein
MKEADVLRVGDYLEHIELAIARIRRYLAGLDRASFCEDLPAMAEQIRALRGGLLKDPSTGD